MIAIAVPDETMVNYTHTQGGLSSHDGCLDSLLNLHVSYWKSTVPIHVTIFSLISPVFFWTNDYTGGGWSVFSLRFTIEPEGNTDIQLKKRAGFISATRRLFTQFSKILFHHVRGKKGY